MEPLQLRSSMSCTWSWLRTSLSSVFTAFISCAGQRSSARRVRDPLPASPNQGTSSRQAGSRDAGGSGLCSAGLCRAREPRHVLSRGTDRPQVPPFPDQRLQRLGGRSVLRLRTVPRSPSAPPDRKAATWGRGGLRDPGSCLLWELLVTKLRALPPPGVKDGDGLSKGRDRQPVWQLKARTGEPLAFRDQVSYKTTAGCLEPRTPGGSKAALLGSAGAEELLGTGRLRRAAHRPLARDRGLLSVLHVLGPRAGVCSEGCTRRHLG